MVTPFMEQITNKSIMTMVKDESNQILRTLRLQLTLGGCSREGSNTSYRDKDKRDGG